MSANFTETRLDKPGSKTDCMYRYGMHEGTQVNLHYPVEQLGSHKAWKGHSATRHLQHSACVLYSEHGRACKGCQGGWRVGMGKPIRNSKAQQAVKWGIGVGTRESRVHGQGPEEEGGDNGTKVANECVS